MPIIITPANLLVTTLKLGSYNDLGLCDTSATALHIRWYQLIRHQERVFLPCLVRHTQKHLPQI